MNTVTVNNGGRTIATSLILNGTTGDGFIQLPIQSGPPAISPGVVKLYSNSSAQLAWSDGTGFDNSFDTSATTANRSWTLPDASGPLVIENTASTLENKTILSTDGNIVDATRIQGHDILSTTPVAENFLKYNGSVWAPSAVTATAPITYSAGNFAATVGTATSTLAAGDDPRFTTPRVIRVKMNNPGAGEFTSIAAAVASITDSATTKRYLVTVGPGIYTEPAIILPGYVTIMGSGTGNTIVRPATNSITLFTLGVETNLRDMAFNGQGGTTSKAIVINGKLLVGFRSLILQNFHTLIYVYSNTGPTNLLAFECFLSGTYVRGFHIDGTVATGAFPVVVISTNMIFSSNATTVNTLRVEGPNANLTMMSMQIANASTGTAFQIEDGATIGVINSQISGCNNGIVVANVGSAPIVRISNTSIFSCTTYDLHILHPGTMGVYEGIANNLKVFVNPASDVVLTYTDSTNSGLVFIGDFNYSPNLGSAPTEIGAMISNVTNLGLYHGGALSIDSGLDINIDAGAGYIADGAYPDNRIFKIEWVDSIMTLTPSTTHYIFVSSLGLDSSSSLPDENTTVLLGRVQTTASGIEFIDNQHVSNIHPLQATIAVERSVVGPLYHAGSIVTANVSRELAISSGKYYYLNNKYEPVGISSPATWYAYYHSSGAFTRASQTVVSNTQYDNLTNLIAIPTGKFVKHVVYIVSAGVNEQYFLVYGQTLFDTLGEAQVGIEPIPPMYFTEGVINIAALIVQEGQATIQDIIDLRPSLNSGSSGTTIVPTDHGDLTGLADDDHLQYLLVNGTRAMSGALDMNGNNIMNVGTIDGTDVALHGARHLPNGADPLASAAPLANLTSTTANLVGTANSFARSDHSHHIDITGFNVDTLSGTLSVPHGGTGQTSLTASRFLAGNGTSAVDLSKVVPAGTVVGTTDVQTLTNKIITGGTSGNDITANSILAVVVDPTAAVANQVLVASSSTAAAWSAVTDSNISGAITVPHGGTGQTTLTASRFLAGNGTSAVDLSKVVPAGTVVGTTDVQTLTGKTIVGGSSGNDITANSILAVDIDITAPTIGQALIATGSTDAAWNNIDDSVIVGAITVPHGGTGLTNLTASRFLVGNGTSAVDLSKVVPAGTIVGTSDAQTLTNKTITGGSSGNDIAANAIRAVTVNAAAASANQVLVASSSTAAAWGSVTDSNLSGAITVPHGGTGQTTLTASRFLAGNGTSAVDLTKVVPTGTVVGTTDVQTLTSKTIVGGSSGNDITANSILAVAVDPTAAAANQVLVASSSTAAAWGSVTDSNLSGAITVPHGGTGQTSLTASRFLAGNGTSAVDLTKVVPAGVVVGTTDAQTLTNKTITGGSSGNDIAANAIRAVAVNVDAPSANQVLIAGSATTAAWGSVTDSNLSGAITVPHGGTGQTTLTSGQFLIGAGTAAVDLTKAAPAGTVVGTSDVQTLTNKTITGGSSGNDITANNIRSVVVNAAAASANQVLVASSSTAAAWGSVTDSVISGAITVPHGGTGQTTLTASRFLAGNGTSAVDLSKVVPTGTVVGTSDTQTLTGKTIVGGSSGNDITANSILAVAVNTTAASANQVLVASSSTAAAWGSITDSSLSGAITVPHGGTGQTTLTASRFLAGNGTSAVDLSKVVPTGTVVGTTDVQTLTNKTIVGGSSGNDITANNIRSVVVNAAAAAANQVLVASSSTAAAWGSVTDSVISGAITVPHGGTGQTTLTASKFLAGNGTSAVDLSKDVPAGVVVGTTDVQTLTNKTITGGASGNNISANLLQGITVSSTAPTSGQFLVYNSGTTSWTPTTSSGGGGSGALASQRWTVKDVKVQGTAGGAATAGSWLTRDLNTLAGSSDTSVTIASNRITFTAGTYYIRAFVPGQRVNNHRSRLQNITDSTTIAYGTTASTDNNTNAITASIIEEYVTFAATKSVEIQHNCTRSQPADGFGLAANITGASEIYTSVCIEKLN